MKKIVFILITTAIFIASANIGKAQVQTPTKQRTSAYSKVHTVNTRPIPYENLREADVIWAKKVWRIIDLREKINLPLYYPKTKKDDRFSLIDLLLHGIQHEGIAAYDVDDDEFTVPITMDNIKVKFGAINDTITEPNADGKMETTIVPGQMITSEVKQIMIKEQWIFDKQASRMIVRIIGICPIREFTKKGSDEILRSQVFWVRYSDVRKLLANHEVFNPFNDAARLSFDQIFNIRRFNGLIYQITNVHDNRRIQDYTMGIESLYEAERLENQISNWEQDLWEY